MKSKEFKSESEIDRLTNRLRREIKQQDKAYKDALKENRPTLNRHKELSLYDQRAHKTARKIARMTLKYMSLQTSCNYAAKIISNDIQAEGVEFDTNVLMNTARKVLRLTTMKIILQHFELSVEDITNIMQLTQQKEFAPRQVTVNPNLNANTPNTKQAILPKDISNLIENNVNRHLKNEQEI